jgi:hypothetical protein
MITISSLKNITKEREKLNLTGNTRAFTFNKPYIFLSARVHPSEVPSSHTLNGVVKIIKLFKLLIIFKILKILLIKYVR